MAIYLFSQILKFTKYSIKFIEKLSRPHLINSSDVFVIKGFTVEQMNNEMSIWTKTPISGEILISSNAQNLKQMIKKMCV